MIKLFVDDIRNPPDDSWVVARTVTEAIRMLATQDVGVVSLDHDIQHGVEVAGCHIAFTCMETFEPVARFICALASSDLQCELATIVLHTANPVGARKMAEIFHEEGLGIVISPMKPVNRLKESK